MPTNNFFSGLTSKTQAIPMAIWKILCLISLLLFVFLGFRMLFFGGHYSNGGTFSFSDFFFALLAGIRFDLATTAIFSGLFFLLLALPVGLRLNKFYLKSIHFGLCLFNLPIFFLNCADVVYYKYAQRRMIHELFTTAGDLQNFSIFDFLSYSWILLIFVFLSAIFIWASKKIVFFQINSTNKSSVKDIIAFILLLPILFLFIRGGWKGIPLRPSQAFATPNLFLGNLAMNTGYNITFGLVEKKQVEVSFLDENFAVQLARNSYKNPFDGPYIDPQYPLLRKAEFQNAAKARNVVILIIESLNAEKMGFMRNKVGKKSITPFLDSLASTGLDFQNFYAAGARSVQALPSILNSIPELDPHPLIGSAYEIQPVHGIGNILKERNYELSFFCGGDNGTMGFDSYLKLSGFLNYYGKDEFLKKGSSKQSNWGIFDSPFLLFLAEHQSKRSKPFLDVWFSITNHFPFELPNDFIIPPEFSGLSAMEKSVFYTDHSLREYFNLVSSEPWFDSTYFFITADHCFFDGHNPQYKPIELFHVPLLITGPEISPGVRQHCASHLDILPTLIELLQLSIWHSSAGLSLVSENVKPVVMNEMMGVINMIHDSLAYCSNFSDYAVPFLRENSNWTQALLEKNSFEIHHLDTLTRALFQVHHNAKIRNAWAKGGVK